MKQYTYIYEQLKLVIVYWSDSNKGEFNYFASILSKTSKTVLLTFSFIDGI